MMQYLLSALDDAVLAYNTVEYKFLFISPAVEQIFGYAEQDFKNNPQLLENIIIPEDKANNEYDLDSITKTGENIIKYRIRSKEGNIKWIQEKRVTIADDDTGHQIRIQIARDISDIVFYRRESEQRMWFMSSLINAINAFVFRIDKEGKYTFVNDAYINRFHYRREQLIGNPISVVIYPDDVDLAYDELQQALLHPDTVRHFRHRKITADGDVRYVINDAIAVRNKEGEVVEVQGVGLDITEQERAKEALITAKKNIETVINNTSDQIWAIDTKQKYVFVNKAYKQWINEVYHFDPVEGMLANDPLSFSPEISFNWNSHYQEVLEGKNILLNYETTNPINKKPIFFEISLNPIFGEDENIIGVSCFAHDITERLKTQHAILSQNERLKNIAIIISHELRKPVANLIGLMNVLDTINLSNPENVHVFRNIELTAIQIDTTVRQIADSTFEE